MNFLSTEISQCSICKASALDDIINLGNQPPANSLAKTSGEVIDVVPLKLLFCNKCGTVQLSQHIAPQQLFSDYVWVTGTSGVANDYSKNFSELVLNKCGLQKPRIIEIASNDGTFLRQFKNAGCDILGIDPAKNIAENAINKGIPTVIDFFSSEVANRIKKNLDENNNVVIARNVIPHVSNIHSVIEGIKVLISEKGVGVIEFHNSSLLVEELQYDYIYHEHLYYFTLKSISKLLSLHQLNIFDMFLSPISGGSYVILFNLVETNGLNKSNYLIKKVDEETANNYDKLETWKSFGIACIKHKKEVTEFLKPFKGHIVGYGASARSSTILNFCGLNAGDIRFIIDNNELKRGKFTAGSGIKIISSLESRSEIMEEDVILILAWNFREEIMKELRSAGFNNKIITLLPNSATLYDNK